MMGLTTIDPYSHKVQTKLYRIPKFGVNRPNSKQDTAISKMSKFTKKCMFLNRCISVKTSLNNTKLGVRVELGVLFLTMWINSCHSLNLQTRT